MTSPEPRGLKPKRPGSIPLAIFGLVLLAVGALVTVTVAGASPLATAGTLAGGLTYGTLLFALPPRRRVLALGAVLVIPAVFMFTSPVQYAWICSVIAGGIAGGYTWRRRRA